MIGVLTAIIGDMAGQFGCWVGLKDAVTAITFVALGTSVPGTFGPRAGEEDCLVCLIIGAVLEPGEFDLVSDTWASKIAATQDKYADSSIGNVTGSNGVNVFLGIGIAWTLAAVYHFFQGKFSFTLTPPAIFVV